MQYVERWTKNIRDVEGGDDVRRIFNESAGPENPKPYRTNPIPRAHDHSIVRIKNVANPCVTTLMQRSSTLFLTCGCMLLPFQGGVLRLTTCRLVFAKEFTPTRTCRDWEVQRKTTEKENPNRAGKHWIPVSWNAWLPRPSLLGFRFHLRCRPKKVG